MLSYDHRPSASIIRIWRQIHRRRKMSRVLWRRQWALWAEGSVATLVSMCFMSQTNQIPPSDDTGKVHNAPGSTPPAYDHQPSVAIISVVCYDHQPSVTIIWFVCHNHHPSYGFWARWQPIVHHFIMTEQSWPRCSEMLGRLPR